MKPLLIATFGLVTVVVSLLLLFGYKGHTIIICTVVPTCKHACTMLFNISLAI